MSNSFFAGIGGLTFRFSGWLSDLEKEDTISAFLIPSGEPDICVEIESVQDIAYPAGRKPDYEIPYLRCYCDGEITHRFYRRDWEETGRDYAHLTYQNDSPDRLKLRICESRLNWSFQQILTCIGIEELLLTHERAMLHASWIMVSGQAILFSGPSGIGKSTQAALWEKYRAAQVYNGDRTLLRSIEGVEYACGLPYAGTSGICVNDAAPIRAIVMLGQGSRNQLRLLSPTEAVKRLLTQLPVPKWNPETIGRAFDVAARVVSSVPVFELICLPDESAVSILENALR